MECLGMETRGPLWGTQGDCLQYRPVHRFDVSCGQMPPVLFYHSWIFDLNMMEVKTQSLHGTAIYAAPLTPQTTPM